MSDSDVLFGFMQARVPMNIPGAQLRQLPALTVTSVAIAGVTPLNSKQTYPGSPLKKTIGLQSRNRALRLYNFFSAHLVRDGRGYDQFSFTCYLAGLIDKEPVGRQIGFKSTPAGLHSITPHTPYVLVTGKEVPVTSCVALPGGFCITVLDKNGRLVICRTADLMAAYGATAIRRVTKAHVQP